MFKNIIICKKVVSKGYCKAIAYLALYFARNSNTTCNLTSFIGCPNEPFHYFLVGYFEYLKHMCVKIIESITGKTATCYLLFWQNKGPKKPICEHISLDKKCGTM